MDLYTSIVSAKEIPWYNKIKYFFYKKRKYVNQAYPCLEITYIVDKGRVILIDANDGQPEPQPHTDHVKGTEKS